MGIIDHLRTVHDIIAYRHAYCDRRQTCVVALRALAGCIERLERGEVVPTAQLNALLARAAGFNAPCAVKADETTDSFLDAAAAADMSDLDALAGCAPTQPAAAAKPATPAELVQQLFRNPPPPGDIEGGWRVFPVNTQAYVAANLQTVNAMARRRGFELSEWSRVTLDTDDRGVYCYRNPAEYARVRARQEANAAIADAHVRHEPLPGHLVRHQRIQLELETLRNAILAIRVQLGTIERAVTAIESVERPPEAATLVRTDIKKLMGDVVTLLQHVKSIRESADV